MFSSIHKIINAFRRNPEKDQQKINWGKEDYNFFYNSKIPFTNEFQVNLKKTIGWTEAIISSIDDLTSIDYVRILRSVNLIYEGKPFYRYYADSPNNVATPNESFNYAKLLVDILELRPEPDLKEVNINDLGKILRFQINVSTYDGAPCAENGFVDTSDIPPIDTWFFLTKTYLYCWIPTLFISKMNDVIAVEMLDSYAWLEGIDPTLNVKIMDKIQNG